MNLVKQFKQTYISLQSTIYQSSQAKYTIQVVTEYKLHLAAIREYKIFDDAQVKLSILVSQERSDLLVQLIISKAKYYGLQCFMASIYFNPLDCIFLQYKNSHYLISLQIQPEKEENLSQWQLFQQQLDNSTNQYISLEHFFSQRDTHQYISYNIVQFLELFKDYQQNQFIKLDANILILWNYIKMDMTLLPQIVAYNINNLIQIPLEILTSQELLNFNFYDYDFINSIKNFIIYQDTFDRDLKLILGLPYEQIYVEIDEDIQNLLQQLQPWLQQRFVQVILKSHSIIREQHKGICWKNQYLIVGDTFDIQDIIQILF